jgi:hypothetical protein
MTLALHPDILDDCGDRLPSLSRPRILGAHSSCRSAALSHGLPPIELDFSDGWDEPTSCAEDQAVSALLCIRTELLFITGTARRRLDAQLQQIAAGYLHPRNNGSYDDLRTHTILSALRTILDALHTRNEELAEIQGA